MSEPVAKCVCTNPKCRKAHITLEENYLAFHYLVKYSDRIGLEEERIIMYMNKTTVELFIKELREFKKTLKS